MKIGVWENNKFIGVIIFARGATPNLGRPYKLRQTECIELSRVALTNHVTHVSKIISISLKFLKTVCKKIRLIVSFADQYQGHHGGIYQAGNWIYLGVGDAAKFYLIKGKVTHPRSIGSAGFIQNLYGARQIDKNACLINMPGKHRYVMPLDANMREQVLPLSKPYPKRPKQAMAGTTGTATG